MENIRIILASASPRRRQLLTQIGINFEVVESGADETAHGAAHKQVEVLALRKADAVRQKISGEAIIIAADTLVELGGEVLSKPVDAEEAFKMLKALQGRRHTVYTGVALVRTGDNKAISAFVEVADVFFRHLSDAEIRAYINTGEPFDKAGAYGVQDRGAAFVRRVEGDYFAVVGLPLARLVEELAKISVT